MSIKGLKEAVAAGIDRANRINATIYIVQIGKDDYVLWRDTTIAALPLVYKYYKIVKVIRYG